MHLMYYMHALVAPKGLHDGLPTYLHACINLDTCSTGALWELPLVNHICSILLLFIARLLALLFFPSGFIALSFRVHPSQSLCASAYGSTPHSGHAMLFVVHTWVQPHAAALLAIICFSLQPCATC